jgi:hypothetical protein
LLALAGFGTVMFGGFLDMIWHNTFGLDETNWSTPHSTIGWGLTLTWLGFLASRLALARHVPVSRPFAMFAAFMCLTAFVGRALGALQNNPTVDVARAVGSLNVLAASSDFQHTVRIVQKYNLTHSNPLFVLLASLGAGAGLALARDLFDATAPGAPAALRRGSFIDRLLGRASRAVLALPRFLSQGKMGFLSVALIVTVLSYTGAHNTANFLDKRVPALDLLANPKNFLPIPYVLAAAAFLAMVALRRSERSSWLVAGFVFGVITAAFWDQRVGLALVAAPLMLLGANLGRRVFASLQTPDRASLRLFVAVALVAPMLTGLADLYMRWTTP